MLVKPWLSGLGQSRVSHPFLGSPDGYLYEREAILEYILHQKKEIARQMKVMRMMRKAHRVCGWFPCPALKQSPARPPPSSLSLGCPQAYEKQRSARREEQKELQRAASQDQVRGFLEKEAAIVSRPLNPFTPKAPSGNGSGEGEQVCRWVGDPQGQVLT